MKKLTVTLALVLSLVLCVFAFASCGKKNADATTAAGTTPAGTAAAQTTAGTTAAETTAAPTQAPHVHTPEDHYSTILKPTCSTPGEQAYYCSECGEIIPGTTVPIEIDPKAHKIDGWTVTQPVDLFHETGRREGFCTLCEETIVEELKFEPEVKTFTPLESARHNRKALLTDVRGEDHFYPTDANPDGKELLIEYSVLWNDTLLNLEPGTGGSDYTYITMRLANSSGTAQTSISFWSTINDNKYADCKFAGGFEYSSDIDQIPAAGADFTPVGMATAGKNFSDYPNIGGPDQENPEWGWHRIQYRVRQSVTNLAELEADTTAGATTAAYKLTYTLYIDGVAVAMLEGSDDNFNSTNYLYSAASDGEGGIVYGDNENPGVYVYALLFNGARAKPDYLAYWVDTDVSITVGTEFVQQVEKVATPAAATFTLDDMDTPDDTADDVTCPAPIYFKLAD